MILKDMCKVGEYITLITVYDSKDSKIPVYTGVVGLIARQQTICDKEVSYWEIKNNEIIVKVE